MTPFFCAYFKQYIDILSDLCYNILWFCMESLHKSDDRREE